MSAVFHRFALCCIAGWLQSRQQQAIDYLLAENKVLRQLLRSQRPPLNDEQRRCLAVRAKALGRAALQHVANIVKPDTLLGWYRDLIVRKYTAPQPRRPGRPLARHKLADLIVTMANDNPSWGYTRIRGALANVGHEVARSTIRRVLLDAGLEPAPERGRRSTWKPFLQNHLGVLAAMDFFNVEVLTFRGLVRYSVLVVMELETRRVHIAGIVHNAYDAWMKQMARNLTDPVHGFLKDVRYLIHDRDPLFRYGFADVLKAGGVRPVMLPARSPNLNSFMERWIRSARSECLRHIIPLGQRHLRSVLSEYVAHYHAERNHQGLGNRLIEPGPDVGVANDNSAFPVRRRQRLGGLLSFYHRKAA
jgi:putative transposase